MWLLFCLSHASCSLLSLSRFLWDELNSCLTSHFVLLLGLLVNCRSFLLFSDECLHMQFPVSRCLPLDALCSACWAPLGGDLRPAESQRGPASRAACVQGLAGWGRGVLPRQVAGRGLPCPSQHRLCLRWFGPVQVQGAASLLCSGHGGGGGCCHVRPWGGGCPVRALGQ